MAKVVGRLKTDGSFKFSSPKYISRKTDEVRGSFRQSLVSKCKTLIEICSSQCQWERHRQNCENTISLQSFRGRTLAMMTDYNFFRFDKWTLRAVGLEAKSFLEQRRGDQVTKGGQLTKEQWNKGRKGSTQVINNGFELRFKKLHWHFKVLKKKFERWSIIMCVKVRWGCRWWWEENKHCTKCHQRQRLKLFQTDKALTNWICWFFVHLFANNVKYFAKVVKKGPFSRVLLQN